MPHGDLILKKNTLALTERASSPKSEITPIQRRRMNFQGAMLLTATKNDLKEIQKPDLFLKSSAPG